MEPLVTRKSKERSGEFGLVLRRPQEGKCLSLGASPF